MDFSSHNTLFSQTLALIPIHVFQKLERRHKTGRASHKFGFKEQFAVMAFIQLAARRSMRDGLRCLATAGNRLYHWGLNNVARSTFADANNSRPVDLFKDLFGEIYGLYAATAPKYKFRFKSKLFSLDATIIKLCLSLFPWAAFRQTKGGIKMHAVLDHEGYTALTVYPLLAYQKLLSRLSLSVQQLFQIIQLNLLGTTSLAELLNP